MELSERLQCLFSAQVEQQDGAYVIEIPEREVELGDVESDGTYRIAMLSRTEKREESLDEREPSGDTRHDGPPVDEGDTRDVEIEDIGEQGDGITRVERGFVVIVPDTDQGERVSVEITDVRDNVAFAEVVERLSYYD